LNYAPINVLSIRSLTPNISNSFVEKIQFLISKLVNPPKNKIGQKKYIFNFKTNPKQNKNNSNTNRKKKHNNQKRKLKKWYTQIL